MVSQVPVSSPSKTLPIRLLRVVVAFTVDDRKTLLQLLLCNRALRLESERILYSKLESWGRDEVDQWNPIPMEKLLGFLERTLSSDRLASYVRRIGLQLHPEDPQLPHFWTVFERALKRMCNVKVFGWISAQGPLPAKCSEVLAKCKSAFQLKVLDWNCRAFDKEITKNMKAFLLAQNRLQHIIMYGWTDEAAVRMTSLVTLRCYSPGAFVAFTSGNRLRALRWNLGLMRTLSGVEQADPELTFELMRGLGCLQHLEIGAASESTVAKLVIHLRHLRTLELQQCREMPNLASLLSHIPHLESVLLDRGDARITREYVRRIFERNANIKVIDIRNDFGGAPYRRWLRDAREPVPGPDRIHNRNFTYLPWNGGWDNMTDEWLAFA
ncbi:hypothetical protein BKA70DRAFT_1246773 [Coprinopsis sp. MPI-PUGE-AT-0042]|nr:hypothetical protein BKA70DRAFT_1246773 [Coprinopsis sp. MPI-PUGE-AT-0042]